VAADVWRLDQHPPKWVLVQAREEHWPLGSSQRWRERLSQLGVVAVAPVYEGRKHARHQLSAIDCGSETQPIDWSHPLPLEDALSRCLERLIAKRRRPAVGRGTAT
jgi:hypothetical protein